MIYITINIHMIYDIEMFVYVKKFKVNILKLKTDS